MQRQRRTRQLQIPLQRSPPTYRRKWAAEIRDTWKRTRKWLGTFNTVKNAATAYNQVAFELYVSRAQLNFYPPYARPPVSSHSTTLRRIFPLPPALNSPMNRHPEPNHHFLFSGSHISSSSVQWRPGRCRAGFACCCNDAG
jgi:hypothetical protein